MLLNQKNGIFHYFLKNNERFIITTVKTKQQPSKKYIKNIFDCLFTNKQKFQISAS